MILFLLIKTSATIMSRLVRSVHFASSLKDSSCHSLFYCKARKHLWKVSDFAHLLRLTKGSCTLDLCCWMSEQLSKSEFEKFSIQGWAIWKERHNFLHDVGRPSIAPSVSLSMALLVDFQAARRLDLCDAKEKQAGLCKWSRLNPNTFKLNVDAFVNEKLSRYGVGGL